MNARLTMMGWAGIVLGVTLVVVALIPAFPPALVSTAGSRSVAASAAPSALSVRGATVSPVVAPAASPGPAHHESTVAGPQRVTIPGISLNATVVPIDLQPDGSLAAPANYSLAGWYAGGAAPGAPGPSVIVGHVDSHLGPAVFFHLRELIPGESIMIETARNETLTFIVERIEQHPKDRFPTTEVYGSTSQRVLRLITCGGDFDHAAGSYRDNVVIFAKLAE